MSEPSSRQNDRESPVPGLTIMADLVVQTWSNRGNACRGKPGKARAFPGVNHGRYPLPVSSVTPSKRTDRMR